MGRKPRPDQVKLQVPIDKQVYKGLEKRAEELGFDSIQAYIRFWAKAQATGQDRATECSGLSRPAAQALRYLELSLALSKSEPASAQEALEQVQAQLNKVKLRKYLEHTLRA